VTDFSTLGEALSARRDSTRAVNFIDGENVERRQPFCDLYPRALGLLHHFQKCGAAPGGEMVILVDRNEQFIDAFWAGVLGNIILVPIAPGTTDEQRMKFFRVLAKLNRPSVCTDSVIFARLTAFAAANGLSDAIERIRSSTVLLDRIEDVSIPGKQYAARADDIAFVQYSSGSTSEPKGVALTHRNLLANIRAIAEGIRLSGTDVGLSWMPLTHDMGLIGFHLTPLVSDVEHHLMPTSLFVRRPQLWLGKASANRASILCSPNFGYRHFLNTFKPETAQTLDLSCVRIMFNGAEPISAELCREFTDAMTPFGLKASAMFPVYGLAEASLAVTFPSPGSGCATLTVRRSALTPGTVVEPVADSEPQGVPIVLVGKPVAGCEVRIAGDAQAELSDYAVGHVLIRGENVTSGYYRDPASTQSAIQNGWLDTGDMGFQSPAGLAITGRAKEIIFVSGQNYYPHDIEIVLEKHAGIEPGKGAACGARPDNASADEVLVFVLHRGNESDFMPIARAVRKAVNEFVGIPVDHVIPVTRIPKTTSGKIQRFKLAESYLNGEFSEVLEALRRLSHDSGAAHEETHGDIERNLKDICDMFLKDRPIGLHDNIFELGTSSLTLAQIYERIEVIYPGQIEVTDFFDYPTIAKLAEYLESRLKSVQA
jgi:acyl-CoA synthetase (AMP-forming)/AMP-acid ligase II